MGFGLGYGTERLNLQVVTNQNRRHLLRLAVPETGLEPKIGD